MGIDHRDDAAGGGKIGVYQPKHASPLAKESRKKTSRRAKPGKRKTGVRAKAKTGARKRRA